LIADRSMFNISGYIGIAQALVNKSLYSFLFGQSTRVLGAVVSLFISTSFY